MDLNRKLLIFTAIMVTLTFIFVSGNPTLGREEVETFSTLHLDTNTVKDTPLARIGEEREILYEVKKEDVLCDGHYHFIDSHYEAIQNTDSQPITCKIQHPVVKSYVELYGYKLFY